MLGPGLWGLLLGSREQKRMLVKQSPPPGTSVRPFGVTVLVPATPKARCAAPREALCGVQTWYVASTREAATKGADTAQKSGEKRAALGFSEDAENALRARMPGERMMISLFKM